MNVSRIIGVSAGAFLAAALLLVQPAYGFGFGHDKARSLRQVGVIHVDANDCGGAFRSELSRRGFGIADSSRRADATLLVSMNEQHNELVGKDGRYHVKLIGDDGKVLWSMVGHENSIDHEELCADISDDVADKLRG